MLHIQSKNEAKFLAKQKIELLCKIPLGPLNSHQRLVIHFVKYMNFIH